MEREVQSSYQNEYFKLIHGEAVLDSALNGARPLVETLRRDGVVFGQHLFTFDETGKVSFDIEYRLTEQKEIKKKHERYENQQE